MEIAVTTDLLRLNYETQRLIQKATWHDRVGSLVCLGTPLIIVKQGLIRVLVYALYTSTRARTDDLEFRGSSLAPLTRFEFAL